MSEQTIRRTERIVDLRAAMPWLVAAGIYVLVIAVAPQLLGDPDTYSHLALGRWIIDHGTVPTVDPFSANFRGTHWLAFEWLSEVVFALAYAAGGWMGMVAIASAAAAIAFGLLTRFLLRELRPTAALFGVLVALPLTAPHILARPHILALPLLVAWIAALIRSVDTRTTPSWLLLPLMTLWANLHGSFTFGLAMIAAAGAEALFRAKPAERMNVIRQWGSFGVLALAAACLNPYGPEMILVTVRTVALGPALATITEWRPQDFSHIGSFEIIMLGGLGLALYLGVKLPLFRILMLLGVLHLSLSHVRHADLLGMLAPIFLARPLAKQFTDLSAGRATAALRSGALIPAILVSVMVVVTALSAFRSDVAPPAKITPANAVHALGSVKHGAILNDYNFGGYLDFVGIAPFIDGRSELYGEAYLLRYDRAVNLQDVADFEKLLDEYRISATLLAPSTPAVALLDRSPGWQRLYTDAFAVVHTRRTETLTRKK
jgi:hypothetical protein